MSDAAVYGEAQVSDLALELTPLATPELRTGVWTRFGSEAVLGDAVTEQTLSNLAESTRTAARSQGYSIGWSEGQRAARAEARAEAEVAAARREQEELVRAAEHRAAVQALELAAEHLHAAVAGVCARIEEQATELAWDLTRELLGRELHSAEGADVVRRVLDLVPSEPIARVRMNPADVPPAGTFEAHGIVVVPDVTLGRGDVLVEADDHVLDLRVETALTRVREVLR